MFRDVTVLPMRVLFTQLHQHLMQVQMFGERGTSHQFGFSSVYTCEKLPGGAAVGHKMEKKQVWTWVLPHECICFLNYMKT